MDGAGEAPRPRESAPLTSVLLVTHGRLAQELLAAAETIAGVRPDIQALALDWNEGIDAARAHDGVVRAQTSPTLSGRLAAP